MRVIVLVVIWLGLAGSVQAAGLAVLFANETYAAQRARGAADVLRVETGLRSAGFVTDQASDLSAPALRAALAEVPGRLTTGRHERVVLVFAGFTLHGAGGAWLMGSETRAPDLANVDLTGVRLETLLAIAGQIQGGAVVAVADMGFAGRPGAGLSPGLPDAVTVPQGVTLVRGSVAQVSGFLRLVARPGITVTAAAAQTRGLRLDGFAPPYLPFLPEGFEPARAADLRAWAAAQDTDTAPGYRAYLDAWPGGLFAEEARAALDRLENTPDRIEAALGLTRDERRAIQRDLTLLGFDPRGIDGLFGPGTRAAISAWQGRQGVERTGFVTREQIFSLAAQAARRAAELEAEARERQLADERADRAWWRDTGAGRDEAGLRAYLDRYPDGQFAGIARERLDQIEGERRAESQRRDRADWQRAEAEDTVVAYRRYLAAWPDGVFAREARERIELLTLPAVPEADLADARAREDALRLPQFSRVLIEQRLAALGHDPGRVDGVFDRDTRRAIRAWQRAAGLPPTGYLNESQVARLVAEGVLRIFD